jgi:hypothetical protein
MENNRTANAQPNGPIRKVAPDQQRSKAPLKKEKKKQRSKASAAPTNRGDKIPRADPPRLGFREGSSALPGLRSRALGGGAALIPRCL